MKEIKRSLQPEQRDRLELIYKEAIIRGENRIAEIVKLALDLSDKGEFYKFEDVFGDVY